jgi:endonuclease-8
MPEGDTIHHAAGRIAPVLVGVVPDEVAAPHPRTASLGWPERLGGREVVDVRARGKHLFVEFEGDLLLHSHLRMTGSWAVYRAGERWRRSPRRAWLVLRARDAEVVQFDRPVLELLTTLRARGDQRIAGLGPDILGSAFDEGEVLRRLRQDDPTRPIGDALLDQRTVAGIGNIWRAESCFGAGVDPWREAGRVSDEEVVAIVRFAREQMQRTVASGLTERPRAVHHRAGLPCPRCGARVESRGQWEDNRTMYWCPSCQH